MQKKKTSETEELYGELGQAFNFTRGDLEANRAGLITKRQEDYISYKFLEESVTNFTMVLASTILLPLILHYEFDIPLLTMICAIIFLLLLISSTLVMPIMKWRELQAAIRNNEIHSFRATAKSIGVGKGHHLAWVGENEIDKIRISRKQYEVVKNRGTYRVYCTLNSNRLLAIE